MGWSPTPPRPRSDQLYTARAAPHRRPRRHGSPPSPPCILSRRSRPQARPRSPACPVDVHNRSAGAHAPPYGPRIG
eukprot:1061416-Prorocentrum_minimum.AAC.1